jgi:hypothetical protein
LEENKVPEKSKSEKYHIFLIILVTIMVFILIYGPHLNYTFPLHIDEWHHISEAIKLRNGVYSGASLEAGFHVILYLLSFIADLVYVYKFLPAIWAVFSALALFYVVNKKTNKFSIALFSIIFFASIKSNANITGLLLFTPLTFSIPFIFLYVYFFTEGIEKQNKKFILISFAIMAFILIIHPISVTFALPFLGIYSLMHLEYIKKQYKFFSSFLVIPVIGILFFSYAEKVPLKRTIGRLLYEIQFRYGWGVVEITNSFYELYSFIGYFLAIAGIIMIFFFCKNLKKYLVYVLWPASVLVLIAIFKLTGVSYLSPYQRNLYYFIIGLPILSAFGLYFILELINGFEFKIPYIKKAISIILIIIIAFFSVKLYYNIPDSLLLYRVINDDNYDALLFLSNFPSSRVMASPSISVALYPISRHKPVATLFFYGKENKGDSESFFS